MSVMTAIILGVCILIFIFMFVLDESNAKRSQSTVSFIDKKIDENCRECKYDK